MTASLQDQLRAWRRREHHDHAQYASDQRHVRQLLARIRAAQRPRPVRGIDISAYQHPVDFRALRAGGIGLVIRKATEGLDYIDPGFERDIAAARAAGHIRGAYHFARPQPGRTGAQEADFFLRIARPHLGRGDLYPCLDLETTKLDVAGTIAYAHDFTRRVYQYTGWQTILYTYPAFITTWGPMPNPLWIAGPGDPRAPHIPGFAPPVIWQNSFTGRVRGINGNVDTDITDTRTLRTITIGGTP